MKSIYSVAQNLTDMQYTSAPVLNRIHSGKESSRKGQDMSLLSISPDKAPRRIMSRGHKECGGGHYDLTNHPHLAQIPKAANP